jgi:nebulin
MFPLVLFVFLQLKYKEAGKKEFNNYSIVTDTPVYVTAILGSTWASEVRG